MGGHAALGRTSGAGGIHQGRQVVFGHHHRRFVSGSLCDEGVVVMPPGGCLITITNKNEVFDEAQLACDFRYGFLVGRMDDDDARGGVR